MKKIFFAFALTLSISAGITQNTATKKPGSQTAISIEVPNFANSATKQFYDAYTSYIKKAVIAVRNKDEATFMKLVLEGKALEQKFEYYMSEKKSTPEDIRKKQAWNKQAMPYIQEIIQSDYNKKLEKE